MSHVYLLSIVLMFSFVPQLHGMRTLGKSFARMNFTGVPKIRVKSTMFRAAVPSVNRGKARPFHASNNTGLHGELAKLQLSENKTEAKVPVIIDVEFEVIGSEEDEYHFDMIVRGGLKYEGEVHDFIGYVAYLYENDKVLYEKYMERVYKLVVSRLADQQYVHPMLVAVLVLSNEHAFKNIVQVLAGNMNRITTENVFASYKVLEMLLKVTPDSETQQLIFKDWDCEIPSEELANMFNTFFKTMPKKINWSHGMIFLRLIHDSTYLLKGLEEKTPRRKHEMAIIKKDLQRYEDAYDKLYMAHH